MLTQFQQRDDRPDQACANIEAIELRTEAKSSASDRRATPTPSNVQTTRVEDNRAIAQMLDLSASRAYDCALEILGAYKLTGNFHINLQIVLEDIDALGKVTFEIEPRFPLLYSTDCRRVRFQPNENLHIGQFNEIIRSIEGRIGFDATRPWWVRVFHYGLSRFNAPFCALPRASGAARRGAPIKI